MSNEAVQLQPEGMLTTIHNNLDKRFFAANKADAKRLFKSISNGYTVPFVKIATSSSGDITCDLKLDHSCFVGTLNFRRFRHALQYQPQCNRCERHVGEEVRQDAHDE